jgi:hypothetical protein
MEGKVKGKNEKVTEGFNNEHFLKVFRFSGIFEVVEVEWKLIDLRWNVKRMHCSFLREFKV